ncbi:FAD:protein FMN transferase [bioreactor metagenome]|uniref:FAD:protein FMN transferase n=1 Tax=bioreactor metagenome TaxID=1076179 RepID=A0A645HU06_9ZZZZ
MIEIYRENGITSAFANLGGNVVVLGSKPDGSPWKVGIQNPRGQNSEIVGIVSVVDKAVVTSGDYQRYFMKDGQRYCHILDPRTGYPIDSGLMSVTIIASSSTDADGLAKAIVLGLDQAMALVQSYGQAEAIFITNDKKIYVTPGLEGNFHLEDATNEYTYIQNG